jgi:hypothetical protein
MRRIRPHLTYANVMATVAVFLALGGGAFAVTHLKKNSVKTKNIKNKAVTEPKLADQAVDNPKIGDKQVKQGKIGIGAVSNDKLADGAVTPGKTSYAVATGAVVSNPGPAQNLQPTLLSALGVTISGTCTESGANHSAALNIVGPTAAVRAWTVPDSGVAFPQQIGLPTTIAQSPTQSAFASVMTIFDITVPGGELALNAQVSINEPGADCVFSLSGTAS